MFAKVFAIPRPGCTPASAATKILLLRRDGVTCGGFGSNSLLQASVSIENSDKLKGTMLSSYKKCFLPMACLAFVAVWSCSSSKSTTGVQAQMQAGAQPVKDRKPAALFTLKDANGHSVQLADYRGKVVLLNFWATWCGPCAIEIPWFIEFEQKYKAQGFAVLGVSMDEDGWTAVKPFLAEHKMNYRVLLGNDSVSQLYGGLDALPTTFIIDREGNVAFPPHIGLINKNDYVAEIESLLDAKQTALRPAHSTLPAVLLFSPAK
jgi:cytochrome c biogenesis protein CcmG/thiol:disulfide interchange protein DsbE